MMITSTVSPTIKTGLQYLGMWLDVPYFTIYWWGLISSMLIIQWFQYLYIFEHLKISELSNLVDGLTSTLESGLTILKLASLWSHRRVLHQIFATMDEDWRECINIDQHLQIMTVKANISHFISNAILSFTVITGVLYFLGEYAIRFVYLTEDYNVTLRQLPLKIQFPFKTQQSPMFEFLFVTTFLYIMLEACAVSIINGLIFTLVLHASGQIDIVCQELRNISRNALLCKSESSISSFGLLIERHNRIISFSDNIEELFSFVALMQVVWNTLVVCCLGFVLMISIHNELSVHVLVKTIFGYVAIMGEAFVICFAGEYLSLKSILIANATYETLWYNMPSNAGKIIILIIMRSQKRLTITAGKMMDMSFETFTNIMKASASYVSVLNAMY